MNFLMLAALKAPAGPRQPVAGYYTPYCSETPRHWCGAGLGVLEGSGCLRRKEARPDIPIVCKGISTLSACRWRLISSARTAVGGTGLIAAFAAVIGFACIVRNRCQLCRLLKPKARPAAFHGGVSRHRAFARPRSNLRAQRFSNGPQPMLQPCGPFETPGLWDISDRSECRSVYQLFYRLVLARADWQRRSLR